MSRAGLTVLACIGLISLGCDDGRGSDDAGGIVIMDAGPGGGDAGGGGNDAGGGGCPPATSPAPQMPMACAAATLTCLMNATTAMAQQACIMNDPNAMACDSCIFADVFNTCSTPAPMGGGCDPQFGEIQCCLMTACPMADQTCIGAALMAGGACAAQAGAFDQCTASAQMMMRCGITNRCFMMMMGGVLPDFDPVEPMSRDWSTPADRAWLVEQFVGSW